MSRSSRALRLLGVLLVGGLGCLQSAGAQDRAVLQIGPVAVRGIPFLPANVLAAHRGEYLLESAAARNETPRSVGARTGEPSPPADVTVFHTVRALVLPGDWSPSRCGGLTVLQVTGEEGYTLCYRDGRGYTLFFAFAGGEPPGGACRFVEGFVRRFQALLGFADPQQGPPFPAVLELTR